MPTEAARRALPREVPMSDAVANAGRSALVLLALTERPELLAEALDDRLHQPYRLAAMPASARAFEEQRAAGMPVCVAGSGPSLLVFETTRRPVQQPASDDWRIVQASVALEGATLDEG
jgi:homoserine kinase